MRLCVVQTRPVTADIGANIERHKALIASAALECVDAIIFPELSLTGYEPTLARELACDPDDRRFGDFQQIADDKNITVGVGVPTRHSSGNLISMIFFRPHDTKRIYSKRYLHRDEEEFFISGESFSVLRIKESHIAPAICYEISIPQHAQDAVANGADFYIASVNKSETAIDAALNRLANIARKYSMSVLMSNCVGFCDGGACAGKTSIWNEKGSLVGQLDDQTEGFLVLDTTTQAVIKRRSHWRHPPRTLL